MVLFFFFSFFSLLFLFTIHNFKVLLSMMEVVGGVLLTYIFVGEYPGTMGIIGTILTTLAVVINGVGNGVLEKRRMKNHNAAGVHVVHVLKKEVTTEKKKEKETKEKEKEEEVELGVELGGVELRVETKKRSREERRESSSRGEIEINVR